MFASVMTTKGQASKEEAKRVIDQLLPRAQSLPGFKGAIVLLDEKGSKGMAVALYESEEVARAGAEARDRLRKEAASQRRLRSSSGRLTEWPR
jgi:polyhydroxyalkanoate synthesis regulator phasin